VKPGVRADIEGRARSRAARQERAVALGANSLFDLLDTQVDSCLSHRVFQLRRRAFSRQRMLKRLQLIVKLLLLPGTPENPIQDGGESLDQH
jgi:hypothetical protein